MNSRLRTVAVCGIRFQEIWKICIGRKENFEGGLCNTVRVEMCVNLTLKISKARLIGGIACEK